MYPVSSLVTSLHAEPARRNTGSSIVQLMFAVEQVFTFTRQLRSPDIRMSAGSCSDTSSSSMLGPAHRSTYRCRCRLQLILVQHIMRCRLWQVGEEGVGKHMRSPSQHTGRHTSATTASSSMGLNVHVEYTRRPPTCAQEDAWAWIRAQHHGQKPKRQSTAGCCDDHSS